jgi:CheY-like chemotaxis protein
LAPLAQVFGKFCSDYSDSGIELLITSAYPYMSPANPAQRPEAYMPFVYPEVPVHSSTSLFRHKPDISTLQRHVHALVISPRLELRKALLQVLESLSADVISCSSKVQAEEVLSRQCFEVVFCDEHLPDGTYADLIHADHCEHRIPRVIVATRVGEWELYLEALRKGAFDVVRSPWHAIDVEMTVIRALHEEEAAASH